jgi:hypothetical protein
MVVLGILLFCWLGHALHGSWFAAGTTSAGNNWVFSGSFATSQQTFVVMLNLNGATVNGNTTVNVTDDAANAYSLLYPPTFYGPGAPPAANYVFVATALANDAHNLNIVTNVAGLGVEAYCLAYGANIHVRSFFVGSGLGIPAVSSGYPRASLCRKARSWSCGWSLPLW